MSNVEFYIDSPCFKLIKDDDKYCLYTLEWLSDCKQVQDYAKEILEKINSEYQLFTTGVFTDISKQLFKHLSTNLRLKTTTDKLINDKYIKIGEAQFNEKYTPKKEEINGLTIADPTLNINTNINSYEESSFSENDEETSDLEVDESEIEIPNKKYSENNIINPLGLALLPPHLIEQQINSFANSFTESQISTSPMKSSAYLGEEGEDKIFKWLQELYPKHETIRTGREPHVCDIHSTDYKNNIRFIFEIKNKLYINQEDLNKFNRDLTGIRESDPKIRNVGIFVSLHCPIQKYGNMSIGKNECYLSDNYVTKECLKLIIETYKTLITSTDENKKSEKNNFDVPANVFHLLAELRREYLNNKKARDVYLQQIEMNNKSTNMMTELVAKTNIQQEFINFINNEFKEILTDEMISATLEEDKEKKLREYLKTKPKSMIKKGVLLEEFPDIPDLKTMTLSAIIEKYKP